MDDTFGLALRRHRTARKLSLRQLADRTSYTPSYISKLENGAKSATAATAGVFDKALDAGGTLVALVDTPGTAPAAPSPLSTGPSFVGAAASTALGTLLDSFVAVDALMGPAAALDAVHSQLRALERSLSADPAARRPELFRWAARYAEHAGWLAQDSGKLPQAAKLTGRALLLARQADDRELETYVWTRRSSIAADAGEPIEAVSFAESALSLSVDGSALRALALRSRATAHAATGDARRCDDDVRRSIEPGAGAAPSPYALYATTAYFESEGAAGLARVGRFAEAVQLATSAVDALAADQQRDRGIALARLANAHLLSGDIEQACAVGGDAVSVVAAAPSSRAVGELRALRHRLHRHHRHGSAHELSHRIRPLLN